MTQKCCISESLLILYLWFHFSGLTNPTPNPGGGKKIFELRECDNRRYISNSLDEKERYGKT